MAGRVDRAVKAVKVDAAAMAEKAAKGTHLVPTPLQANPAGEVGTAGTAATVVTEGKAPKAAISGFTIKNGTASPRSWMWRRPRPKVSSLEPAASEEMWGMPAKAEPEEPTALPAKPQTVTVDIRIAPTELIRATPVLPVFSPYTLRS
jgi:hypothetical protein